MRFRTKGSWACACAALLLLAAQGPVHAASELRVIERLGADEHGVLIHHPVSIAWAQDGRALVLAQGSGEVLTFSPDWELIGRFGRVGEGPGDIADGLAVFVDSSGVHVIERDYISRFSHRGEVLSKRQLPPELAQAAWPVRLRDRLAAIAPFAPSVALTFDYDGGDLSALGPECGIQHVGMTCMAYVVTCTSNGSVKLFDLIASEVLSFDDTLMEWERFPLHLEEGHVWVESGATYWQTPLRAVAPALDGSMFLAVRPESPPRESDEVRPWEIHLIDSSLQLIDRWILPEEVGVYDLFVSPVGELCVVDRWDSVVYIMAPPSRDRRDRVSGDSIR